MTSYKKTKIIATLGPATSSSQMIGKLIDAGMNVARLNFSHGTHEQHAELFAKVKSEAKKRNCNIAVLGDLSGPKIRTGDLGKGLSLENNTIITLTPPSSNEGIPINNAEIFKDLKTNDEILLDDGYLKLIVVNSGKNFAKCKVIHGGLLKSHKGVNLPGTSLSIPTLTEKDKLDAYFGMDLGLDFFALSFVQRPQDILDLKNIVGNKPIIAKIERPVAVENLDKILGVSDGFMVARGDLGIEIGPEHVPVVQKNMIIEARKCAKPVITATQMLESMINNPIPTRAEVSDVANAVLDGTSAVMLSAETASGQFPVEAVEMLNKIINEVENNPFFTSENISFPVNDKFSNSIAHSAFSVSKELNLNCIAVFSQTGETARQIAKYRPDIPVVAITSRLEVLDQLTMHWGIIPLFLEDVGNNSTRIDELINLLKDKHLVIPGDKIAITFGMGFSGIGRTDTLHLHTV